MHDTANRQDHSVVGNRQGAHGIGVYLISTTRNQAIKRESTAVHSRPDGTAHAVARSAFLATDRQKHVLYLNADDTAIAACCRSEK